MTQQNHPLVVDIDGSFLRTDMLFELFWHGMATQPLKTLRTVALNFRHRAKLKAELAENVALDLELLPVNTDVVEEMARASDAGREVVFASASPQKLVSDLAALHGLEGAQMGSSADQNLKGSAKAEALVAAYGDQGFDYIGDSAADVPVWQAAKHAYLVGERPAVEAERAAAGRATTVIDTPSILRPLIKQLRPHQWVKNALLFMPIIAAHRTDLLGYLYVLMGAVAFCLAASSIYIVNDLLDLEADRKHPTKRNRPLAAGTLPIQIGMAAFFVLVVTALALGSFLGAPFMGVLLLYIILSISYSLKLKRLAWFDLFTLSGLYTIRVIAGALAATVAASGWLIAFIFPAFVALGCTKRLTELAFAAKKGKVPGRGYRRKDQRGLLMLAGAAAFAAMFVHTVYTFSPTAIGLYADIWMLRVTIFTAGFWLVRMVVLGWQGQQDYDPIVFAMRDVTGLLIITITVAILFYAAGIIEQFFPPFVRALLG